MLYEFKGERRKRSGSIVEEVEPKVSPEAFLNARIKLAGRRSGTLSGWFHWETGTEEEHVGIHGQ